MKKIILTLIFTLMSSITFADGHSGKIDLKGFFVGDAKVIVDESLVFIARDSYAISEHKKC